MAKRTRGSSSRPGQRSPLQRARPGAPMTRPVSLTAEEEARAAELEAKILDEERAAETAQRKTRERDRKAAADREQAPRAAVPLTVRAAEEYAYVARDVRRLTIVAGGLFAIMFGLWIAFQATGAAA